MSGNNAPKSTMMTRNLLVWLCFFLLLFSLGGSGLNPLIVDQVLSEYRPFSKQYLFTCKRIILLYIFSSFEKQIVYGSEV
ncbi:MAG: hypothetical protein ACTFAK_02900 [Candidatus Electronema sp. VV]